MGRRKKCAAGAGDKPRSFPPPQRISLSAQRLSQAQQVWYLISGATKKNALLRWQQGKVLPMSAITPPNGVDVFVAQA
ncbi:MAG: 6-phosphogluconolactonase [Pseudomonadales bacterium]